MATAKVTSKGQVTIPKIVRDSLGLCPGDRIEFVSEDGMCRIVKQQCESPFEKWRGYLSHLRGKDVDELVREMRGH